MRDDEVNDQGDTHRPKGTKVTPYGRSIEFLVYEPECAK